MLVSLTLLSLFLCSWLPILQGLPRLVSGLGAATVLERCPLKEALTPTSLYVCPMATSLPHLLTKHRSMCLPPAHHCAAWVIGKGFDYLLNLTWDR